MYWLAFVVYWCDLHDPSQGKGIICCTDNPKRKSQKTVAAQSEIHNFWTLQLKLELIRNKRNKFRIRGFSLGIADGIAEKSLQRVQIASVPGYFDGVADGSFHPGRGGLEGFRHLGVQYFGDGIGVLTARLGASWMGSVKPPWTTNFLGAFIALSVAHITVGLLGLSQW